MTDENKPELPPLTAKQENFCIEYSKTLRPGDAYRSAYDVANSSNDTIHNHARELLKHPGVAARIKELRAKVIEGNEFGVMDVLRQWIGIATANPADLIRYRHLCCRNCYGVDGAYQWTDANEYAMAVARAIDNNKPLPDMSGGYGFYPIQPPNDACKHCGGEGRGDIFITPTDKLSPSAKLLYAGLRTTRDGVQVLMRDQDDALRNIARFLGMAKTEVELRTGEKTSVTPISEITTDTVHASQIYQKIVRGT